jgi:DNA polymerase-3 subunit gamma/tau
MSYLVLARKWRPQNFEEIAGQEHITRTLQNAIQSNRIAHAYLFTGVRGVGKTTAARILAKALNCEKGPTPKPCNQCSQCEQITSGAAIDVLEIDGASNRGIDEIRQIIENVRYQPAQSRFKIYVIDEVHQVTKDAFNALLKTLEEPPPSVKFILATTEPHRLPETILSRCQRYDFRSIALREIVQQLEKISKKEGLKITEGALVLLAREADGSMRDAQSLLEQVLACAQSTNESGASVDEGLLHDILGLAKRHVLYDLSKAVLEGNAAGCIELVSEVAAEGRDLCRLSRDLLEHFRNLLVARLLDAAKKRENLVEARLLDLPEQEIQELRIQAKDVSIETLLDYFDFMAAGDEELARSSNPRFALETIMVRLATLPKTLPVAQLLERLERLEKSLSGDVGGASTSIDYGPSENFQKLASAPASPVAGKRDDTWQDFISFVSREKKFLALHLDGAIALELPPGQLKIGVAERHHLNYLQDADNFSALKSLAKRFFADDVAVNVTAVDPNTGGTKNETTGSEAAGVAAEGSSMVEEALRIFGGSIKAVRRENG